jgi:hypothetical protein
VTTPTRIVVEVDDGDITTITSDHPVEVVIINSTDSVVEAQIESAIEGDVIPIIPDDLTLDGNPESAKVFENFNAEVDKESVEEVFTYIQDNRRQSVYSRLVFNYYRKLQEDEEEHEDEDNDSEEED